MTIVEIIIRELTKGLRGDGSGGRLGVSIGQKLLV